MGEARSELAESVVVGAGLAGLVAAINLARDGREVLVLEKEFTVGGPHSYRPSPGVAFMDPGALTGYAGVDLRPGAARPAVASFRKCRAVVRGQMVPLDANTLSAFGVERGPRPTSLDNYLYEIAAAEGVKFEFGRAVSSTEISGLPPCTVLATGLDASGFEAARVPHRDSVHFVARATQPFGSGSHLTMYFGGFTREHGYTVSMNGLDGAHLFGLDDLGEDDLKAFEERVFLSEGMEFESWERLVLPVPARTADAPGLFAGDKILAGALSGCLDPFALLGVLGALVSGKIAATALDDRAGAAREFEVLAASIARCRHFGNLARAAPLPIWNVVLRFFLEHALPRQQIAQVARRAVPGWRNCERTPGGGTSV